MHIRQAVVLPAHDRPVAVHTHCGTLGYSMLELCLVNGMLHVSMQQMSVQNGVLVLQCM